MKEFTKLFFRIVISRVFTYGIIFISQIIWLGFILFNIFELAPALITVGELVSVLMVLYVINTEDDPAYKILWITLILTVPIIGGFLYFFFGNKKPSRKLAKAYEIQKSQTKYTTYPKADLNEIDDFAIRGVSKYLLYENYPTYFNSQIKYYASGEDIYREMIKDLKAAKYFIFMEYFIIHDGMMLQGIMDILEAKVKEGVEVRFLYDDIGSVNLVSRNYYKILQRKGIKAMAFNRFTPLFSIAMNNRDHRKITVIDGSISFCGGFNLADEYINKKERFGYWKDTGVKIVGGASWNLTQIFLETWNVANKTLEEYDKYHPRHYPKIEFTNSGLVAPYADSPLDNRPIGVNVYLNIINNAHDYVYITTPYLILNNTLEQALLLAAKRGVDVRIITPGIPDKKLVFRITRSYYHILTKYGVKIYEYTPGFMHAKNFVCDDKLATVGTINLDYRSLYLHFECGIFFAENAAVTEVKEDFLKALQQAKKIEHDDPIVKKYQSLFDRILRIFGPLL